MRVALTFDAEHPDRPTVSGVEEQLLDVLDDLEVRATFFVQGRWAEAFPSTPAVWPPGTWSATIRTTTAGCRCCPTRDCPPTFPPPSPPFAAI